MRTQKRAGAATEFDGSGMSGSGAADSKAESLGCAGKRLGVLPFPDSPLPARPDSDAPRSLVSASRGAFPG